jgi:hypothetical protein
MSLYFMKVNSRGNCQRNGSCFGSCYHTIGDLDRSTGKQSTDTWLCEGLWLKGSVGKLGCLPAVKGCIELRPLFLKRSINPGNHRIAQPLSIEGFDAAEKAQALEES